MRAAAVASLLMHLCVVAWLARTATADPDAAREIENAGFEIALGEDRPSVVEKMENFHTPATAPFADEEPLPPDPKPRSAMEETRPPSPEPIDRTPSAAGPTETADREHPPLDPPLRSVETPPHPAPAETVVARPPPATKPRPPKARREGETRAIPSGSVPSAPREAGPSAPLSPSTAGTSEASSSGPSPDHAERIRAWLERHKEYPRRARERRMEGTALLSFTMDSEGRVLSRSLERSSGSDILDRAALDMIDRASPLPIPSGAPPSRLTVVVPVTFALR